MNGFAISPVLIVFLVLLIIPIKIKSTQLKMLAFGIWLAGGAMMSIRGLSYLTAGTEGTTLLIALLLSIVIGGAKGKFVLSKTSQKNIDRLDALTEPQKPIHVYSLRSWIIISVMVLIAMSLTVFNVDPTIRGAIVLGVGMALIVSSLAYVKSLKPVSNAQ